MGTEKVKRVIYVHACLNSNQPRGMDVSEYNVYVYDEQGNEIEGYWRPDKLRFEVYDYLEVLQQTYTVVNVKWIDLEGNEMFL